MPNEEKSLVDEINEIIGGLPSGAGDKEDAVEEEVQPAPDPVESAGEKEEKVEEAKEDFTIKEESVPEAGETGDKGSKVDTEVKGEAVEEVVETPTAETAAVDDRDQTIQALRDQLVELHGRMLETKVARPVVSETREVKPEISSAGFKLPADVDFDDVMNDKGTFEKVMNGALDGILQNLTTRILTSIPQTVTQHVQQTLTLREVTEDFYKQNEDLRPVRKLVGSIADRIVTEKPEIKLNDLFAQSAEEARKVLGLTKKASATTVTVPSGGSTGKVLKPSFASTRGTARPSGGGKIDPLKQQIKDLIS